MPPKRGAFFKRDGLSDKSHVEGHVGESGKTWEDKSPIGPLGEASRPARTFPESLVGLPPLTPPWESTLIKIPLFFAKENYIPIARDTDR